MTTGHAARVRHALADRTQQQAGEATAPAVAEHQDLGGAREREQPRGSVADERIPFDGRGRCDLTGLIERGRGHRLRDLPDHVGVATVRAGSCLLRVPLEGVHDAQRQVTTLRLARRPAYGGSA
jgi:hypothetical protein